MNWDSNSNSTKSSSTKTISSDNLKQQDCCATVAYGAHVCVCTAIRISNLHCNKSVVDSFFLHQFVMCAQFCNFTILESSNDISISNSGQPVSHYNGGPAQPHLCRCKKYSYIHTNTNTDKQYFQCFSRLLYFWLPYLTLLAQ